MRYVVALFLALFFHFPRVASADGLEKKWSHIEYGGANVESGATRVEAGDKLELDLLKRTLVEMVENYGDNGTFYVNDLNPGMTQRAANALKAFALLKGFNGVAIVALPGDFTNNLSIPFTNTAHLKNPPREFFEGRDSGHSALQRLANRSLHGLQVVTSQPQLDLFAQHFSNIHDMGEGEFYVDPKGKVITHKKTKLYQVDPNEHFTQNVIDALWVDSCGARLSEFERLMSR